MCICISHVIFQFCVWTAEPLVLIIQSDCQHRKKMTTKINFFKFESEFLRFWNRLCVWIDLLWRIDLLTRVVKNWLAKLPLILISAMPHIFDWKVCQNGWKRPFCVCWYGAPQVLQWEVVSCAGVVVKTQDYNSTIHGYFSKVLLRDEYRGSLYRCT